MANAENTAGPHNESPHGGGRRRLPPPCGEGRPEAAPHYVVRQYFQHWPLLVFVTLATSCFFSIGLRLYFQLLPPIVFSVFAPACIFSFWPPLVCSACGLHLYFQLWPPLVFLAFAPHCVTGQLGPKKDVSSASVHTYMAASILFVRQILSLPITVPPWTCPRACPRA